MAKSVSSIYDNLENLVPFYPNVVYCQSTGRPPKDEIQLKVDMMDEDAMFLKCALGVPFEQSLRWFRGDATNPERHECEGAMKRQLANCEENERNRLMAICRQYSLSIVGETICSQKTSNPSSEMKSDMTAMKQVRTTKAEGQEVTHVTQAGRIEGTPPGWGMGQYWQEYYDFWDEFVRCWFQECRGDQTSTVYRKIAEGYRMCVNDLNFAELPTPYLGTPAQTVQAVIIHLNPGGSAKDKDGFSLDETQLYPNIDIDKKGWLIKCFRDNAGLSYRRHIDEWSCLNSSLRGHNPEVCGVRWWQGNDPAVVGGRMKWIKQIYNKEITPESVFALELCPYHSVSFGNLRHGTVYNNVVLPFIKKHVIVPAVKAVVGNNLDFAVAIGAQVAHVLEDLGATCEKEWTYESHTGRWPKNDKNEYVERKYKLFNLKCEDGMNARFLVTWVASGGIGIPAPSEKFKEVEHEIRKSIVSNSFGISDTSCATGNEENMTRKESLKGNNVNRKNIDFWEAFKKWCLENGRTWCTADIATRGNPYYDPQGHGECYIFFTLGERSGGTKGCGPLVTIGIYCAKGEEERSQIRKFRDDFEKQFSSCKFFSQDWESGTGAAKRILFVRQADYRNPSENLFKRMADDYEGILTVMRAHGYSLPVKKWK